MIENGRLELAVAIFRYTHYNGHPGMQVVKIGRENTIQNV